MSDHATSDHVHREEFLTRGKSPHCTPRQKDRSLPSILGISGGGSQLTTAVSTPPPIANKWCHPAFAWFWPCQ